MRFDILTIFPHILDSYINESIMKRAKEAGLVDIRFWDIRNYTTDKHKTVDDTPYGGGPGMVLKIEPIYRCLDAVIGKERIVQKLKTQNSKLKTTTQNSKLILLSPKGEQFNQKQAYEFSQLEQLVLISGRYEGTDERVTNLVDEEISIGPYVLSGGELAAMVVVEAVSRLIPGFLGSSDSLTVESFNLEEKYREYPQYTRPAVFKPIKDIEWAVPEVLLSGNHKEVEKWRKKRMGEN